ncbi:hypothetical protein CBL_12097 [Carabus blaptoides fortunei]
MDRQRMKILQLNLQRSYECMLDVGECMNRERIDISLLQEPYAWEGSVRGIPNMRVIEVQGRAKAAVIVKGNINVFVTDLAFTIMDSSSKTDNDIENKHDDTGKKRRRMFRDRDVDELKERYVRCETELIDGLKCSSTGKATLPRGQFEMVIVALNELKSYFTDALLEREHLLGSVTEQDRFKNLLESMECEHNSNKMFAARGAAAGHVCGATRSWFAHPAIAISPSGDQEARVGACQTGSRTLDALQKCKKFGEGELKAESPRKIGPKITIYDVSEDIKSNAALLEELYERNLDTVSYP